LELLGKNKLQKLKIKNRGNQQLGKEIDRLIKEIDENDANTLLKLRTDADCVHSEGFYFFDINVHRTLIMLEIEDDGQATVVWVGTHQEYEAVFKNNKKTVEKWLRKNDYIE
jgi:hypothetical protein